MTCYLTYYRETLYFLPLSVWLDTFSIFWSYEECIYAFSTPCNCKIVTDFQNKLKCSWFTVNDLCIIRYVSIIASAASRCVFGTVWTVWVPKKIFPTSFSCIFYVKTKWNTCTFFRNKNHFKRHKHASPNALNIKVFGLVCATSPFFIQLWYALKSNT